MLWGSRNDMTITSTMNDDIKMWCSVFGNVKPFVDVPFGESDRRLLDVEVEHLCDFLRTKKWKGLKITWTSTSLTTNPYASSSPSEIPLHMWFIFFVQVIYDFG